MADELIEAVRERCGTQIVQNLLNEGADVSAADSNGLTALHIAARLNSTTHARKLLEAGASVLAKDIIGDTPLHVAARDAHPATAELLLKADGGQAAAVMVNQAGQTPLHLAAASERDHCAAHLVRLLLQAGSRLDAKDAQGRVPEDVIREVGVREQITKWKQRHAVSEQQQDQPEELQQQQSASAAAAAGSESAGTHESTDKRRTRRRLNPGPATPAAAAILAPPAAAEAEAPEAEPPAAAARRAAAQHTAATPATPARIPVAPATTKGPGAHPVVAAGAAGSPPFAAAAAAAAAAVPLDDETCHNLSEVFKKGYALLTELQQRNVPFTDLIAAEGQLSAAAAALQSTALSPTKRDLWLNTVGASVTWYYNIMADQGGDAAWQHNVLHLLQRCNTAAAAEPPAPAAGSSSSAAAVTLDDETCQNLSEVFKKGFALLTELQQHNVPFPDLATAEGQLSAAAAALQSTTLSPVRRDLWFNTIGASSTWYHAIMADQGASEAWQQNVLRLLQRCNTA